MFKKSMVNNVPEYASEYKVWVATLVDDELWFYGAYDSMMEAADVAIAIHGYTCK